MEAWIAQQRAALQEEREEEKTLISDALAQRSPQECQDLGVSLLHLVISGTHTGLYGRTCISLGPSPAVRRDGALPAHGFGVGDEVRLTSSRGSGTSASVEGVVSRVTPTRLDFLVGSSDDLDDEVVDAWSSPAASLRLDMLCNEATHRKMMEALQALERYTDGPALRLVNLLFGNVEPSVPRPPPALTKTVSADLNESQRGAVAFALATDDVALIHGPPGTGKTTAVVELILQAAARGQRLLVCAPSNVAVDNIVERIVLARSMQQTGPKPRIVRLGHPARLSPQVLQHSLEALIEAADGTEIVRDIRTELRGLEGKRPRDRDARRAWRGELKSLRKEMRVREEQVVRQIIRTRDIVLCTNVGAATKVLKEEVFDVVVIDEAAQALEASCWIPLLKAPRLVLAGDHKQLAPTIKSVKAERMGLGLTLFDRLMTLMGQTHSRMLTVQYRMHRIISDWASAAMYGGALLPAEAVASWRVSGLPYAAAAADMTDCPMLLLDTAGCGMEEAEDEDDEGGQKGRSKEEEKEEGGKGKPQKKKGARGLLARSHSNRGEALVVQAHVQALMAAGLRQEDVAVITPYNGQVELLRGLLSGELPRLEIRSVDGFQGGEKEAVVLSLVRSNASRTVGFLSDDRRLNVAVTRAKRHCAVVCDSETVSHHPFLAGLVRYVEEHGEYRSALEYLPEWGGGGGGGGGGGEPAVVGRKGAGKEGGERRKVVGEKKAAVKTAPGKREGPDRRGRGHGREGSGEEGAAEQGGGSSGPVVDDNELVASVLRFVMDPTAGPRLELSPDLSGRQRKLVHELVDGMAARHVTHESEGTGRDRRLVLTKANPTTPTAAQGTVTPVVVVEAVAAEEGGEEEEEDGEGEEEEEDEEEECGAAANGGRSESQQANGGRGQAGGPSAGKKSKKKKGKQQQQKAQGVSSRAAAAEERSALSSMTGGFTLGGGSGGGGGGGAARPTNSLMASLHAERQARTGTSGQKPPPPPRPPAQAKAGGGRAAATEEELDDMELLERAIAGNMTMTEMARPPSEGFKARMYGWDTNLVVKKDLQKKLSEKLKDSAHDRKPASKDDNKKGGGGKGGANRK